MEKNPVKVGIVGVGKISKAYIDRMKTFPILEIYACSDLDKQRAETVAAEHSIPKAMTVKEMIADPAVEIILNLTIPEAHAEVSLAALEAGKHVYGEKPLAVKREDGKRVLDKAKERKLLVGCAPDTVLGAGMQTSRKLIDDGWIGRPVAATAFMMGHGPESWHPNPFFFYQAGGGPMFDMGPYYLTALATLLGPVRRVCGLTGSAFEERQVTSQPHFGASIKVETPTHVSGLLHYRSGAVGTIVTSFDVWAAQLPRIEIYGTEGSISVPDPNGFGGPVRIRRMGASEWSEIPMTHGYADGGRGLGVADMAYAIRYGRKHRANGEIAYHILDLMHAFHESSAQGKFIEIQSTCERPNPFPLGMTPTLLDR